MAERWPLATIAMQSGTPLESLLPCADKAKADYDHGADHGVGRSEIARRLHELGEDEQAARVSAFYKSP